MTRYTTASTAMMVLPTGVPTTMATSMPASTQATEMMLDETITLL